MCQFFLADELLPGKFVKKAKSNNENRKKILDSAPDSDPGKFLVSSLTRTVSVHQVSL